MLYLQIDQKNFRKQQLTGLSDHHKLIVSFFLGYHLKDWIHAVTIKNLIWKAFFMNLIKIY